MTPAHRVAVLEAIKRNRATIAAYSFGVTAFNDPRVGALYALGPGHTISFHRKEGSSYHLPIDASFRYVQTNPLASIDFLVQVVSFALMSIADAVDKTSSYPSRPEFQFLKQCRNAVGHGNRITMNADAKPAAFLSYEITPGMSGAKLFRDSTGEGMLQLGDALALVDCLESILQKGEEHRSS